MSGSNLFYNPQGIPVSNANIIAPANPAFPYDIVVLAAAPTDQSYMIGYVDEVEALADDYTSLPRRYFQVLDETGVAQVPDSYLHVAPGAELYVAGAISHYVNSQVVTEAVRFVEHYREMSDGAPALILRTSTIPTLAG